MYICVYTPLWVCKWRRGRSADFRRALRPLWKATRRSEVTEWTCSALHIIYMWNISRKYSSSAKYRQRKEYTALTESHARWFGWFKEAEEKRGSNISSSAMLYRRRGTINAWWHSRFPFSCVASCKDFKLFRFFIFRNDTNLMAAANLCNARAPWNKSKVVDGRAQPVIHEVGSHPKGWGGGDNGECEFRKDGADRLHRR